jgi:hypothetical protein
VACGCRGGNAGRGGANETLGYYVVMPDGSTRPAGIDPDNPSAGTPPYMLYAEAHSQVLGVGGTIHRLKRKKR